MIEGDEPVKVRSPPRECEPERLNLSEFACKPALRVTAWLGAKVEGRAVEDGPVRH